MRNPSTKLLGSLHVADLAREADVTPATVRYYARIGLIHPDREPDNGYRCFSGTDLRRVLFIRQAKALGLTIGDIKAILETADQGNVPCYQVKSLVEQRLVSIRERIAELQATEEQIVRATSTWEQMNDQTPVNGELCPLIERLGALNDDSVSPAQQPQRRSNIAHQHPLVNDARSSWQADSIGLPLIGR